MSDIVGAVALGWTLAALLFLLSLGRPAAGFGRRHRHAAMAGALILTGTALYGADIINLPEIGGALVIGAAIGLLLARDLPMRLLPRLLGMLGGSIGVGAVCMALAVRRNPYAFGLLGETAANIAPWRVAALAIALLAGTMAGGAGVARLGARANGMAGVILAVLLALAGGGSFALFGWGEKMLWLLAVGIALAVPAGVLLGGRVRAAGETALLAVIGGLVGWAAGAIGFLLENTGLALAGGLAGGAGTLLALRLCVEANGKGLAHGRRHA